MDTLTPKRANSQFKNTGTDNFLYQVTQYTHYRVIFYLQNDKLIIAGGAGQVMRAASLLNSGADIQTKDWVRMLH